jgi:hypothetical protein
VNATTPRRKPIIHSTPLPYEEAVQIFGSEEELKRSAGRLSRLSNWKKRGVPPGIILPILLQRFRSERDERKVVGFGEVSLPTAMQDLLRLLNDPANTRMAHLPKSYRQRYEERVAEAIARVKRELEEYQAVLEAEHRTGPRRRRRRGNDQSQVSR